MKTVTGKLVSTKPISLSNAAKYISRFTSSDNGASHAIGVYLQRASDSFSSLVHFQKKLKGSHSRREEQVSQLLDIDAKVEALGTAYENPQGEKIKKSERKGTEKKNEGFELKNDFPLEIKQNKVVIDEVKVRESSENKGKDQKNQIFEVNNEETTVKIEQSPDGVFEKKKNKKSGKEKGKNEETLRIGVDGEDADEKVLDDAGEKKWQEIVEVQGGSMKRDKKKKRKKGEDEEVGEEGKKREDRKVDGGETIDQSEHRGKKNTRKSEGYDQIKQEIMEDEGDMNGAEGVSVQKRDKKKKKRKENEDKEAEYCIGGEGGQKQKSRGVDGGEAVDLVDKSGKKKGSEADGNDKIKQLNVEVKGEADRVEEGSVEMKDKKKKKRKKSDGQEVEKSFGGEDGKTKSREDGGETVNLAEQSGKNRGSEVNGNDKIKQDNVELKGEMDRVDEGSVAMKDKKKKKRKSEVEEVERSLGGEEGKKRKSRDVDGEETIDLAEQIEKKKKKKKKRRKIEGDGK